MRPFSDAQDFHRTSTVGNALDRLNYRFETCFEPVRDRLAGARVLELGSHDGRFTWAVLEHLGAAHVTGLERDRAAIAHAEASLAALGVAPERFRFVAGEVEDTLPLEPPGAYDAVLNTGFLYYVHDPAGLLAALRALGAVFMLFDGHHCSTEAVLASGGGYRGQAELEALFQRTAWAARPVDHRGGYAGYGRGTRVSYWCDAV
ncbi:MAG: class I SAM-dependent methyltransferase [Planctomycetota bacterium]